MAFTKNFVFFMAAMFAISTAQAGLVTNSQPGATVESVQTYNLVQTSMRGQPEDLKLVGAGLRSKKLGFLKFKVYVAEYFKSENSQMIRLTFLRDVEAEKVEGAFIDSLKANSIDLNSAPIKSFLSAVKKASKATEKSTMTIMGFKKDSSTDSIIFEDAKGQSARIDAPAGFVNNIFSIWLGKASDEDLAELQKRFKQ